MTTCTLSGNSTGGGGGGGVCSWCTDAANAGCGGGGGGIYNGGAITLTTCTLSGNFTGGGGLGGFGNEGDGGDAGSGGGGGGIYNGGTMTLTTCTLSGNSTGSGGEGGEGGTENGGNAGSGGGGGGVYNGGTLTLTACTLSQNSTGEGGQGGDSQARGSGSSGNGGDGGGIYNGGTLTLNGSTLSQNSSGNGGGGGWDTFGNEGVGGQGGDGGAICNTGVLSLAFCTVSGNTAGGGGQGGSGGYPEGGQLGGGGGGGGGISGPATLINCTVFGNSTGSGGSGAGLFTQYDYPLGGNGGGGGSGGGIFGGATLINCTIASNFTAQGGSFSGVGQPGSPGNGGGISGPAQLLNTLVAYNTAAGSGPDVSSNFTSLGCNLIGNTNGSSGFGATGDLLNVNPLLAPLANNGGPTPTCALLPGSLAIDAGTNAVLSAPYYLTTDQRGYPRPSDLHVDIGAFEFVFVCPGDDLCDGVPDSWRAQYFSNQPTNNANGAATNNLSCATCDADGTGQNNLLKYLAGLDPTNPSSFFGITSVTQQSNDVLVTWTSVGGHSYVLQSTKSTAMTAQYNTNFFDTSPVIAVSGSGPSTTSYLDIGAAYAPVLTAPGGQMITTSTAPSTVDCSAIWTRGLTDSLGNALPIGSLLMLGTFSINDATIQSNFLTGNLSAIMSAFTPYTNAFAVGDGTDQPASWDIEQSAAGFAGQQIYLVAVDAPTFGEATHLGIFTAPSWIFPSDGNEIAIDLEDVTDFVIGAKGGPLTLNLVLGGETYTFTDTARLSVLPGRMLFYRVRLGP